MRAPALAPAKGPPRAKRAPASARASEGGEAWRRRAASERRRERAQRATASIGWRRHDWQWGRPVVLLVFASAAALGMSAAAEREPDGAQPSSGADPRPASFKKAYEDRCGGHPIGVVITDDQNGFTRRYGFAYTVDRGFHSVQLKRGGKLL